LSCHKPLIAEYHQMLLHNMSIYICFEMSWCFFKSAVKSCLTTSCW
jgi:hypothetical protein